MPGVGSAQGFFERPVEEYQVGGLTRCDVPGRASRIVQGREQTA